MLNTTDVKRVFGVEAANSGDMLSHINLWMNMYTSDPWLKLPSSIASEIARLTTIEMESEITGGTRAAFLNECYQQALKILRIHTEYGCAGGGMVMKPYISGDTIAIDFIQANAFTPITFDSTGRMTSAIFQNKLIKGDTYYTRLEFHKLSGNTYTVENKAFKSGDPSYLGGEIPLSSVEEWAGLTPSATLHNISRPLFAYFKVPIANVVDPSSPLGASVYSRAVGLIDEANKQFERLVWEFKSGERKLYIDDRAFRVDPETKKPALPDTRLYHALDMGTDKEGFFYDYSPACREAAILNGLNKILQTIEYTCGLAYGTISDPQNVDKTAEEIRASKQRSYCLVSDTQKALESALDDLIAAMDIYCDIYGIGGTGSYNVSFSWDDSIVADRQAEFMERMQLTTAQILKPWEFRVWYLGEDEETAKAIVGDGTDKGDGFPPEE